MPVLLGHDEHIPEVTTDYMVGQGISGFRGEWAYRKYIKMSSVLNKNESWRDGSTDAGTC